jgi:Holliday junction resolvase RusA-like endonuclease
MQARLEIKPLSVNEAWQGRRFKSVKYKKFELDVLLLLPKSKEVYSDMIRIELFFGFSNVLSDLDNPVKMTLDILQKKYGFNDKNIFELNVRKCKTEKGKEFISIQIENLLPFDFENQK